MRLVLLSRVFILLALCKRSAAALSVSCKDTPGWDNRSGKSCFDYHKEQWCSHGAFTPSKEWTGGAQFNYPERACCVCGKQSVVAPSIEESAPAEKESAAAAEAEQPPEVKEALQGRLSTCVAHTMPRSASQTLLYFARLPRTGRCVYHTLLAQLRTGSDVLTRRPCLSVCSAIACKMMGACSGRQARSACGEQMAVADVASVRANACPHDAASAFSFYGSEKVRPRPPSTNATHSLVCLCAAPSIDVYACVRSTVCSRCRQLSPSNYGCAAGPNSSNPTCLSFGGDEVAMCNYMGSTKVPGAVMMATERFPPFAAPPCITLRPAVRMLALLRDPGERAQSAFQYVLDGCICNFRCAPEPGLG